VRFKEAFRDHWALPMGLAVKEANLRTKRAEETFLEFFYAKLALLRSAYPQNPAEAHIEMIKSCLDDPHAAGWARESRNLSIFEAELRDYDNHLRRYPGLLARTKPSPGHMLGYTAKGTGSSGLSAMGGRAAMSSIRVKRSPEEITALNKERAASLAVRTNDKGEKVMSFKREDGTLVFLRDPCSICKREGKPNQMHFSFMCPLNKLGGGKRERAAVNVAAGLGDDKSDLDDLDDLVDDEGSGNDEGVQA